MESLAKLKHFFSQYKKRSYKKHEIILHANEAPPGVFFIESGFTRFYRVSEAGQEITLIIFQKDDFFPVMWAINNVPNINYVEAVTDVKISVAPRDDFIKFIQKNPDVLFEITSEMLVRIGGLLERVEYLAFGNAYQKIASILILCAERFGDHIDSGVVIKVPLTHKDIGMLVGITRETTSTEIKKMEDQNLIDYRGQFIKILDMKELRKESLFDD